MKCEIRMKLPSLNDYVRMCRQNRFQASAMKRDIEEQIMYFLRPLPEYKHPIKIHFHWIEENAKRDLDNIAFAKKFILDAMVKAGKIDDDNRRHVTGFIDSFSYGKETMVILDIKEDKDAKTQGRRDGDSRHQRRGK